MPKKTIEFTKMQGAGNDFIIIEAKKGLNYASLAKKVCDRTAGIGADGLLVLDRSKTEDFKLQIFNADGSQAEMCGNGARCLAAYIAQDRKLRARLFSIETKAGRIYAQAQGERALVQLSHPTGYTPDITIPAEGRDLQLHFIDTGVPHAVIFVADIEKIDVNAIGRFIRYHERFAPRGTNVNFVEQMEEDLVAVRTYERGVEGETKACGTGSVASAIIAYLQSHPGITERRQARMRVLTVSGEILQITFDLKDQAMTNVWLKGSAKFIAEGKFFW